MASGDYPTSVAGKSAIVSITLPFGKRHLVKVRQTVCWMPFTVMSSLHCRLVKQPSQDVSSQDVSRRDVSKASADGFGNPSKLADLILAEGLRAG